MFKKAFKIALTIAALFGAYRAYGIGFAILTDQVGAARTRPAGLDFPVTESRTSREATRIAIESLGPDHPAAAKDLKIRLYDAARGFYMYATDYTREDNGRRFIFTRFAIIWMDRSGKGRKIATSDRAIVKLNEPIGLIRAGSEASHVVAATLEGNVVLRDDKGTFADPTDDLVMVAAPGVGLPWIKYTEEGEQPEITSKSTIHLTDRDLTVDGFDLKILLRKRDAAGAGNGFEAQTAFLQQDVRIEARNVGKAGVLPGTAQGGKPGGSTPGGVSSAGPMQLDFPPKPRLADGPPPPEGPTIATFRRNVEVWRGEKGPDRLTGCDTLTLQLVPVVRQDRLVAPPGGPAAIVGLASVLPGGGGPTVRTADADSGPLSSLTLSQARGTGTALWLTSAAQGMEARCNELIYKRQMPASDDITYLRADPGKQLRVMKTNHAGPPEAPGPVTSVVYLWSNDATIFDGKQGPGSVIIARGPGRMESHASADQPVEQSASWATELQMRTVPIVPGTIAPAPSKRLVTLVGSPVMTDHLKKTEIEARQSIVVSLLPIEKPKAGPAVVASKPKPKADPKAAAGTAPDAPLLGGGAYRIEWVEARQGVVLTSPSKTLKARDTLSATFEQVVAELVAAPPTAVTPTDPFAPATPDRKPTGRGPAVASAASGGKESPKTGESPKADPKAKPPAEPATLVSANKIWTKIHQNGATSEIAEAQLRGAVQVDQDPSPGASRGYHNRGEALDLRSVGKGLYFVNVFEADPQAVQAGDTRLAAGDGARIAVPAPAYVETPDYIITGPRIGLDQSRDLAWVIGKGKMAQLTDAGFLTDKAKRPEPRKADAPARPKVKLVVSWEREMRFDGRSKDPEGRPSAKTEFRGKVDAGMADKRVVGDEIDTYTDRPVSLARSAGKAGPGPLGSPDREGRDPRVAPAAVNREDVPEETLIARKDQADLVYFEVRDAKVKDREWNPATIITIKSDPETDQHIEKQFLQGTLTRYDKRTGDYYVEGPGLVRLWRRSAVEPKGKPAPLPAARRPDVRPVALRVEDVDARPVRPGVKPPEKRYTPWQLTQGVFTAYLQGRFGTATDAEGDSEPRTADLYGVKLITATVESDTSRIDWDTARRRNPDFKYMTADALRIVDIPPPPGVKDVAARQLITADGGSPQAHTATRSVAGDYLTYDTEKGLFVAYGEGGREASVTEQAVPGQPATYVHGSSVIDNTRTKFAQVVDPTAIHFVDNQGEQFGAAGPPGEPGGLAKRKRPDLRPPGMSHVERRGFTGK